MDTELLSCGYSYHMETFYIERTSSLPAFLFRIQTEGSCEALVDGKLTRIEAGDLLLYKPGDEYELRIEETDKTDGTTISSGDYFLFCQGAWIEEWWGRTPKAAVSRIELDERLLTLWRQLLLEKRRVEEEDPELCSYLLRALCIYLERASTEKTLLPSRTFTGTRMKRFIEEHATTTFKIEDVARHVGLSVSRAVHLFKECFGKTMIQHALEIRLSLAIERMRYSRMTLEQISLSCGFGSYAYFHRVFKEAYGVSPKTYRLNSTYELISP
jgi:AraC family transcriptional regulator of arabinose operon